MTPHCVGTRRGPWGTRSAVWCLVTGVTIVGLTLEAHPNAEPQDARTRELAAAAGEPVAGEAADPALDDVFEYIGSKKCRGCHAKQYGTWRQTPHGDALALLEPGERTDAKLAAGLDPARDYTAEAACLPCHTVGFGKPGGFVSTKASRLLAGVGCEACHGAGDSYAKVMGNGDPDHPFEAVISQGLVYPVPEEVCRRCHNDNAPFNPSLDPKYGLDYSDEALETATHGHKALRHRHGPPPPGVRF